MGNILIGIILLLMGGMFLYLISCTPALKNKDTIIFYILLFAGAGMCTAGAVYMFFIH